MVPMVFAAAIIASAAPLRAAAARPYYEGKTIQLIVAFAPGGVTDNSARLVGRYLGKHIPGNPNLIVQNMPGGGGIISANFIYGIAKRDGLTIGSLGRANYLEQMVGRPEVRFDFRRFDWVGSFNNAPMMLACRADSGLTNVEKIRAAPRPPRMAQGGSGSISFIFASLVEEALGSSFTMSWATNRAVKSISRWSAAKPTAAPALTSRSCARPGPNGSTKNS